MAQTEDATIKKKKKVEAQNVLSDDRFSAMFERPEFQVDMESDEYRLLNPLVSQIDKVSSYTWKQRLRFVNLLVCCFICHSPVHLLLRIGSLFIFWIPLHFWISLLNGCSLCPLGEQEEGEEGSKGGG